MSEYVRKQQPLPGTIWVRKFLPWRSHIVQRRNFDTVNFTDGDGASFGELWRSDWKCVGVVLPSGKQCRVEYQYHDAANPNSRMEVTNIVTPFVDEDYQVEIVWNGLTYAGTGRSTVAAFDYLWTDAGNVSRDLVASGRVSYDGKLSMIPRECTPEESATYRRRATAEARTKEELRRELVRVVDADNAPFGAARRHAVFGACERSEVSIEQARELLVLVSVYENLRGGLTRPHPRALEMARTGATISTLSEVTEVLEAYERMRGLI